MVRLTRIAVAGLLLTGAIGCSSASKYSRRVAHVDTEPGDDEVVVVFARLLEYGATMHASVFECWDEERSQLVGLVADGQKVVHRTTPGEHLFMVVGGSADFMHAHFDAGNVYYVLVKPGMDGWRTHFSLQPVHAADRPKLKGWLARTFWIENTPASQRWAQQNATDIENKRSRYYPPWRRKPSEERPTLHAADGLSEAQ
jgi:hypothetical protein